MGTVRITKRRDVVRVLLNGGWRIARHGKHEVWTHPNGARPISLGYEGGELPPGTIHQILRRAAAVQAPADNRVPVESPSAPSSTPAAHSAPSSGATRSTSRGAREGAPAPACKKKRPAWDQQTGR